MSVLRMNTSRTLVNPFCLISLKAETCQLFSGKKVLKAAACTELILLSQLVWNNVLHTVTCLGGKKVGFLRLTLRITR